MAKKGISLCNRCSLCAKETQTISLVSKNYHESWLQSESNRTRRLVPNEDREISLYRIKCFQLSKIQMIQNKILWSKGHFVVEMVTLVSLMWLMLYGHQEKQVGKLQGLKISLLRIIISACCLKEKKNTQVVQAKNWDLGRSSDRRRRRYGHSEYGGMGIAKGHTK
ncbi:hypothetical protein H5410_047194 [Solanum commersonii]|uniref:Uncharacterized protein n=1 Tax=Solanum commersonii TaxID=4109 RepID=A0A9J5XIG8_SOLCO|nr:hypothetical protein H5410_047194 [Solanum commersonii]